MTPVRVVERDGKYILQTMFGNPIGPRLWGSEPPNGLPPINDIFDTKDKAWACRRGGRIGWRTRCWIWQPIPTFPWWT